MADVYDFRAANPKKGGRKKANEEPELCNVVRYPTFVSTNTVQCLEQLLKLARDGTMIGIAYAAMFTGREYIVDTAGECTPSRTFTRGMVDELADSLRSSDSDRK